MLRRLLIGLNCVSFLALWSIERAHEAAIMATGDLALGSQVVAFPVAIVVALDIWYLCAKAQ